MTVDQHPAPSSRAQYERANDHWNAERAHLAGIAAGHRQPHYYTGSHPFAGGIGDPARGAFNPTPRHKPGKRRGRR